MGLFRDIGDHKKCLVHRLWRVYSFPGNNVFRSLLSSIEKNKDVPKAPKLNRLDVTGIDEYQLLSYRSASDKMAILTHSKGRIIMVLAQQALRSLTSH